MDPTPTVAAIVVLATLKRLAFLPHFPSASTAKSSFGRGVRQWWGPIFGGRPLFFLSAYLALAALVVSRLADSFSPARSLRSAPCPADGGIRHACELALLSVAVLNTILDFGLLLVCLHKVYAWALISSSTGTAISSQASDECSREQLDGPGRLLRALARVMSLFLNHAASFSPQNPNAPLRQKDDALASPARRHEPPFLTSWVPFLGSAVAYGMTPFSYLRRQGNKHGDVFTMFTAGQLMTVVLYNKTTKPFYDYFYRAPDSEMSFFLPLRIVQLPRVVGVAFEHIDATLMSKVARKLVPRFARLTEELDREVQRILDFELGTAVTGQDEGRSVNLWSFADRLVLGMSFFALCRPLAADPEAINLVKELEELAQTLIKQPGVLGAKTLARVDAVRAQIHAKIIPELQRRRHEQAQGGEQPEDTDLLDIMMEIAPADDTLCVDAVVGFLFGAVANTNAALVYLLSHLAASPKLLTAAEGEIYRVLGDTSEEQRQPLSFEALSPMKLTEALINETGRLYSIVMSMRTTRVPVDLAQFGLGPYRIPAGRVVAISAALAMRDPDAFANPNVFDPRRWMSLEDVENSVSDPSLLGLGPHPPSAPFNYVFGQARHMCKGMVLAKVEIKLVLARLLERVRITRVTAKKLDEAGVPEQEWISLGLAFPKDKNSAMLHFVPRQR
jgi:sterol 14-demethylase